MVHLVRGESGDARPSGSPSPSSFRLALEETGVGLVTWPFPSPGWHGGVSPSSPGTGGRGASSRKLLLGSGRRVTNTALLMVRELFSLSLGIFFFSSSSSSQQPAWSLFLSQVSRGSSEPPFIDPHERSAARLRRRPGQGPGPRLGSQRQPWAPPGRSRRRGTWGVARQGRGGEGKQSRIRARSTGEGGGSGAPHRPFYAKDPSGPPPPPRPPPAPPAPARPGFQHRSCFQQSLRAPNVLRALPTKTALWI